MANIHIHQSRSRSAAPTQRLGRGSLLNNIMFWLLLGVMAVSPLPLGGARPLYWEVAAIVIGALAVLYFLAALILRQKVRFGLDQLWPQALAFLVVCAWLALQAAPVIPTPIVLWDGTTLPSSSISIAPGATILMLLRQLSYGLFFVLLMQVCANRERRALLAELLLWMITAYGLYGMISYFSGDTILGVPKWAYEGYVTGPFVNRNSFATFLAMGGVIAAARVGRVLADGAEKHPNDGRVEHYFSNLAIYGLAYCFLSVVVLMTGSRMGAFVMVLGGFLAAGLALSRSGRWAALAMLVPAAVVLAVVTLGLYGQVLFERIESLETGTIIRTQFYDQIWLLIQQRPWTGFGGGTFELAYPLVHLPPVNSDVIWSKAHNSYMALWSELGLVVGTLPMLILAVSAFYMVRAFVRKTGRLESPAIGLGVLAVGAVHSLVDFSLEIPANTLVFLALIAVGTAATINDGQSGS